jgi:putative PIN family toxin of toxin-antitoxin system
MSVRVLLDANIYLSYLLAPAGQRTINQVIEMCYSGRVTLVIPPELLQEVLDTLLNKPYLRTHILMAEINRFVEQSAAFVVPPIPTAAHPRAGRDPKDAYLIAYALQYNIDYLVTGDKDLLVLGQIGDTKIVQPATLLALLAPTDEGSDT